MMSSWFAEAAQWIGSRPSSSLRLASVGSAYQFRDEDTSLAWRFFFFFFFFFSW
jgi:hypothetical protein